jgi:tetratricopeptide (TPR) repeat protein
MAVEQAGPFWETQVRQQAEAVVSKRSGQMLLLGELIAALSDDPSLSPSVKAKALELARDWPRLAYNLNDASWRVVRLPDQDSSAYRRALRQAEEACRLAPGNGMIRNTLGMAEYRCGLLPKALKTLERSNELNGGNSPGDLAVLAMTQYRLGQHDVARQMLERLRALMKGPPQARNQSPDNRGLLREAEAVIELDPSFPADPFAR